MEDWVIDPLKTFHKTLNLRFLHFLHASTICYKHSIILGSAVEQIDRESIFMGASKTVSQLIISIALGGMIAPIIFRLEYRWNVVIMGRGGSHVGFLHGTL